MTAERPSQCGICVCAAGVVSRSTACRSRFVRGTIVGLLGPSGSGKTTLMRAVVGVQRIQTGEVTVLGELAGSQGLRRRIAYMTQAVSVYADLEVVENLEYFAKVLGAPASRIAEVVDTVALGGYEHDLVGQLSEGQRARVSLATALLGRTRTARPRRTHSRPRSRTPPRPLERVSWPRGSRSHAARLEPRDGRGSAL